MLIEYPRRFPLPSSQPYAIAANMGVIRTPFAAGNTRQRRAFRNMPQMFSLAFQLHTYELYDWQYWANANAYDWFSLPLASMYAPPARWSPDGVQPPGLIAPHVARFISDLAISADGFDLFSVTVQAELSPEMWAKVKPPPASFVIEGGSPANPSLDILDGRFPSAPAPGGPVNAGTPDNPS